MRASQRGSKRRAQPRSRDAIQLALKAARPACGAGGPALLKGWMQKTTSGSRQLYARRRSSDIFVAFRQRRKPGRSNTSSPRIRPYSRRILRRMLFSPRERRNAHGKRNAQIFHIRQLRKDHRPRCQFPDHCDPAIRKIPLSALSHPQFAALRHLVLQKKTAQFRKNIVVEDLHGKALPGTNCK